MFFNIKKRKVEVEIDVPHGVPHLRMPKGTSISTFILLLITRNP
jgi:hypothetical protein